MIGQRTPHLLPVLIDLPLVKFSSGLSDPQSPHDILDPQLVPHDLLTRRIVDTSNREEDHWRQR